MAFCTNCGHQLADGVKFCAECGMKVATTATEHRTANSHEEGTATYSERKQEYAGIIIKCPSCGAEIPSFTAICPDCGHEINSRHISSHIREFSDAIDEYDKAIAKESEQPPTGWKIWSKKKRTLWVILNIFTVFIPWVIYLVFPLVKPFIFRKSVPVLSINEKQKAALIENANFPNEREATIEAMMFTKSKMAFLASEKYDKKTQYWTNLWNTKAKQLNQRASIILKGDKVVEATYADIVSSKNIVDKHIRMRAIIGAVIIGAYLVLILVCGSLLGDIGNVFSGLKLPGIGVSQSAWLDTGLSAKIPAVNSRKVKYMTNSDTELNVNVEGFSYSQFENYVTKCKDLGYTIEASKDTHEYTAYNEAGYYLDLQYWESSKRLDISLKAPLSGDPNFQWPSHSFAAMLPEITGKEGKTEISSDEKLRICILNVSTEELSAYISECETKGFTIDSEKKTKSYTAFNTDGYKLTVSLGDVRDLSITIEAPMKFSNIDWPSTGPAILIPRPTFTVGSISSDYDWVFSVYLGNMTIDDFNTYIEECLESGFVKSLRTERYFSADKGENISLTVEYVGFNTVVIRVYDHDKL